LRTKAEQDAIYAQGRTKPGKIVSNAKYPQSLHCWGIAFDIAVKIGGKVTWDVTHYKKVGSIGQRVGLEWGGAWAKFPDYPHFQLPGYTWRGLQGKYDTPDKFIASWKAIKVEQEDDGELTPTTVFYNGKSIEGFINKDNKTLVEVRALTELFGKTVEWNALKKVVEVKD
jgi:peptidoglycan L-alanyl-D-glutamate endopeptidase CwlK